MGMAGVMVTVDFDTVNNFLFKSVRDIASSPPSYTFTA